MFQPSVHCPAEARLHTFFDPSQPRDFFTYAEIEDIKLLLSQCPHYSYASSAPRTFIVLCYIDRLQVLHQLLADGFEDSWFPVLKQGSLPTFLDPRIKAAIVEHQKIISTKSIDIEEGIHCHFGATEELSFHRGSYLGHGSFGHVCRIESKVTGRHYALKTIRRVDAYGLKSRRVMDQFISEMTMMKRLRHYHIVRYIGSYTDKKDLGLVMSPVADYDLAKYLSFCTQSKEHATLQTFYGCLASALAYLHDKAIRHRDIKPSNILVHRSSVLITDFGLSHESWDSTSGTNPGTIRYQSPEVAACDRRNESTDVWSLGCVFLEILAALNGHDVNWLMTYYQGIGTGLTHFHANVLATQRLLSFWRSSITEHARPISWIETMLVTDRSARPTAAHVAAEITATGDRVSFKYSCSKCIDNSSDSDSMSATDDSISMAERPKSAPTHDRSPAQPFFRKRIGVYPDHGSNARKLVYQSRSRSATEGEDTEHADSTSDHEGEDISIEDYDSDQIDAIDFEQPPSEVHDRQTVGIRQAIDQLPCRQISRTRPDHPQKYSGLHESRLLQRRDSTVATSASTSEGRVKAPYQNAQQESQMLEEAPESNARFMSQLWDLSVSDAVIDAGLSINRMSFIVYGVEVTFSGRVPIVVARCIEKVVCNNNDAATTAMHCLRLESCPSHPENFVQLKDEFNTPASYGIEIDWSRYTATDAIDILFDYLTSLRNPLIPSELSCELPPLDSYIQQDQMPSDMASLQVYSICLARMPKSSRQLLLILIAFLASQISCLEKLLQNDSDWLYNKAASQWSFIISHPLNYRSATFKLLIVNAVYFLSRANGKPPTPAEWEAHISARSELVARTTDKAAQQEKMQPRGFNSVAELQQVAINMAALSVSEEQMQEQRLDQKQEQDTTQEGEHGDERENDYEDRHGSGRAPRHNNSPIVEYNVVKGDQQVGDLPLEDDEITLKERKRPPERLLAHRTVDSEDTDAADEPEPRFAAKAEETDDKFHHLGVPAPDLAPAQLPPPPPPESEQQSYPPSVMGVLLSQEKLQHNDWPTRQDTLGQNDDLPLVSHLTQAPRKSTAVEPSIVHDWQQYLYGISRPPTPSQKRLPRLNITPADDPVPVETTSDEPFQQERLTPIESPLKPDQKRDFRAAKTPVRRKSHRKSWNGWPSSRTEVRSRSAAGESGKSERRRSKDDERELRPRPDSKKKRSLFRKPKTGLREYIHGVKK